MKIRVLALSLMVVMCLFAFVACGDDAREKVTVNVKATADGSMFIDTVVVLEFDSKDGYVPSALDAIIQACRDLELTYTLWNNDMSLACISGEGVGPYDSNVEGENGETMWWRYTINGAEPEDDTATIGEISVKNGDTVEIFFEKFVVSDKK